MLAESQSQNLQSTLGIDRRIDGDVVSRVAENLLPYCKQSRDIRHRQRAGAHPDFGNASQTASCDLHWTTTVYHTLGPEWCRLHQLTIEVEGQDAAEQRSCDERWSP